jgi:hypothetical protein
MINTPVGRPVPAAGPVEPGSVKQEEPSRYLTIVIIKSLHTIIFWLVSSCVMYVFFNGIRGRSTRLMTPAIFIVLAEGAVFFGNRWRCPLTQLTEKLGASKGQITDIFLPRWFAQRIPQIYTPPFIIGLAGLLWHWWRGRNPAK